MLNENQIAELEEADRVINEFKQDLVSLENAIMVQVAPALKELSNSIRGVANNSDLKARFPPSLKAWQPVSNISAQARAA